MNPLSCYHGGAYLNGSVVEDSSTEDGKTNSEESNQTELALNLNEKKETVLLTGANLRPYETVLRHRLDQLCPPLISTPPLELKALRAVFSVGIDMVVLDAEVSARFGRLALRPEHMITSDDTDELFGQFQVDK